MRVGPSAIHGLGVFATRDIREGEDVTGDLFREGDEAYVASATEEQQHFGVWLAALDGGIWCIPRDVLDPSPGWYLNHADEPNLVSPGVWDVYVAARGIAVGEELTIDYRTLGPGNEV